MEEKSVGVSMEEVMRLIANLNEQNQNNFMAFAAEMKKPSPREQEKIDKEEARLKQHQAHRLKMAQVEEDRKKNSARACSHATYHPGTGVTKHQWRAQVHTPAHEKPYFVPTCTICLTQLPKILATTEMLTNGVNLDQYVGIDADRLRKWAEQAQEVA